MKKVIDSSLMATEGQNNGSSQPANAAEIQSLVMQKLNAAASTPTEYQTKFDAHIIDMQKEYAPTEYVFSTDGVPHMNTSELHLVTAAAKSGKTKFTNILCAATIADNQQWGNIKCLLPYKERLVIVFDCEENEFDTATNNKQILRMAGFSENNNHPLLKVFNLRQNMSYEERREFVFDTIRRYKPKLAIIDGLRDLILDINDPKENPQLMSDLMSLASETRSAIICILHNNPNSDKARGWSGTEGINRCGYTYNLEKKGNVVTVSVPIYRHAPVPDFRFTFDADGSPTCEEYKIQYAIRETELQKQKEQEAAKAQKDKVHLQIILNVLNEHNGEYKRSELVKVIDDMNIEGFKRSKIHDFIKVHLESEHPRFTEQIGSGKMVLVGIYQQADLFSEV